MTHKHLLCVLMLGCFSSPALAQTDRVYLADGKVISGKIDQVVRQGISVSKSGKVDNYPAGQISKILFQGDPPQLTRGREATLDGQFEEALEQLRSIKLDDLPRDLIRADAEFYRLFCEGRLALLGKYDRKAAIKSARDFVTKHPKSWHFFEVAKLLGHLAIAVGDAPRAISYYKTLETAPTNETKVESKYLVGKAKLVQGDIEGARDDLQKVVAVNIASRRGARIKTLATAKLAESLAKAGSGEEAKKLSRKVLADLDSLDVELASHVYNSNGAVFESLGDQEGAILSYLRTDLMCSSVPEAHAEALARLAELWVKVGKPDRAAKAKQQLKQLYPGYSG